MHVLDEEYRKLESLIEKIRAESGRLTARIEGDTKRGRWRAWLVGEDNEWGGCWLYADGTKLTPRGEPCGP